MKIVQGSSLDSISAYEMHETDIPEPERGQVVIEVAACGVGYVDSLLALGRYQVRPALPHVPGQEAAGRVHSVGAGVADLAPGDRVMAAVRGGFAQYARACASETWRIPPRMTFAQAAGFRINYLTALHGLRDRAQLAAGERLLVLGAAGGVGVAAMQVGRAMGAQVIAVASSDAKRAFALSHGAHTALDTEPEGWRDRLKAACDGTGPDVVFDPVCGALFEQAFRSLVWRGRHLVVGFVGGPVPALRANLSLIKGASMVGVDVRQFTVYEPERARSSLRELLEWTGDGRLDPPVGSEFAFDEFRAALEFGLTGQGLGKSVLRVTNED